MEEENEELVEEKLKSAKGKPIKENHAKKEKLVEEKEVNNLIFSPI